MILYYFKAATIFKPYRRKLIDDTVDATLKKLVAKNSMCKYRIKTCSNFKYGLDREAIDYHINFCKKEYKYVSEETWTQIFNNNNDNDNNWPSIFRKANKTSRENEIIQKFIGRWRADSAFSPLVGALTRNMPSSWGLWKWPYYARLFFSFEFRDTMKDYLEEFPDLCPEPGFVIYFYGDTPYSFDMFD